MYFSKVIEIKKHLLYPRKQHNVKTDTAVIQELVRMAIFEISKIYGVSALNICINYIKVRIICKNKLYGLYVLLATVGIFHKKF